MRELEELLNRRWILKSEEKELYYRVRDAIGEVRKFASEKMGCQVLENSLLVKMEKIPVVPKSFMGVQEFSSKEEYAFLCILLMFLEDKDQDQFVLSQLTEYVAANMPGGSVDWTLYANRRRLIRTLRYAASQGILKVTDGSDDSFMDNAEGEVLYENTGASHYFMRNFSRDIMTYTKPENFRESDWFAMDEDRGIARRHRVYKRLLFAPGMYRSEGSPEDFEYLKYYGKRLGDDLEQTFDCRLQIHKGSAYVMLGEDCRMGAAFPANNALSDILLLCFAKIREKIDGGSWEKDADELCRVDLMELEALMRSVKEEFGQGFIKGYREMPAGEFVRVILEEMETKAFVRTSREARQAVIYPAVGKIQGHFPEDYEENAGSEEKTKSKKSGRRKKK